jgi:catechol 2,3-dioxygenase-like lactoylglutathione lyase family enzyme
LLKDFPIYAMIPAADVGRARDWYERNLGLTPLQEDGGALLYASGPVMFMIYQTPSAGTGKHTLACWVVDDIDAAVSDLRARGVRLEDYAYGDAGPNTIDGVQRFEVGGGSAWFTDSEGNVLSVAQLPPG